MLFRSSRLTVRGLIRRCRDTFPGLDSVACAEAVPPEIRDVLVQEGIRTALVPPFTAAVRGGRRPAPRGWPCRSLAWGLWEVSGSARVATGLGAWIAGWSGGPTVRPGGLSVLVAGADEAARLQAWRSWAGRRSERGAIRVIRLSQLPEAIAGAGRGGLSGSVLKAA